MFTLQTKYYFANDLFYVKNAENKRNQCVIRAPPSCKWCVALPITHVCFIVYANLVRSENCN